MQHKGASITSFLTDGSLTALCHAAGELIGLDVLLVDEHNQVIVTEGGVAGDGPLRVASGGPAPAGAIHEPIRIDGRIIGSVAALARGDDITGSTRVFLEMLSLIVSETCTQEVERAARQAELDALHRLARILVTHGGFEEIIGAGLHSAIKVLKADAGAIRLLDDTGQALTLRASEGLSDDYVTAAASLPIDEGIARATLNGEAVAIDDIASDPRVLRREAVRKEGLASMLSAGLVFRDETMGVIRLYTRSPRSFTEAECAVLSSIGRQIATAIATARLINQATEARTVQNQIRIASHIQRRMLPSEVPSLPGLDIAAEYDSCFDLGGDFYDLFEAHDSLGIVVGDVVGKGVAAALLMADVRASLRAFAEAEPDVARVLHRTNLALCRDSLPNEFVTIFYAMLDPRTRRLRYCSAGHEPTLLVRNTATEPSFERLDEGGIVVGVEPQQPYEQLTTTLEPGDVLVAFTDGLNEAMNFDRRMFGRERIRKSIVDVLAEFPDAGAKRIASHLLWEMRRYIGMADQSDDTTIVVVRARP